MLTGKWLTENDPLTKLYINGYQHVESKPRNCTKRRSRVAAFCFKEGIKYYPIKFKTNFDCSVFRALFENKCCKILCVIHRPQSLILNQFFVGFENLLSF